MNQVISTTFAGLGTVASFTATTTDFYSFGITLTLPTLITAKRASAVVVTINQNGSPVFTGPAGVQGIQTGLQCTAGDAITVVLSSSLATDAQPLMVKSTISISEGN